MLTLCSSSLRLRSHLRLRRISFTLSTARIAHNFGDSFDSVTNPTSPYYLNRTIFFWAPLAKWALVIAGIKDLARPADKLSFSQNAALAATGFIWVSY
jgi:hypothetical protein